MKSLASKTKKNEISVVKPNFISWWMLKKLANLSYYLPMHMHFL